MTQNVCVLEIRQRKTSQLTTREEGMGEAF